MPSDGSAELAALLTGLHDCGMTIGVDDAGRVARAFTHSRDWTHEQRIRALKGLLARTDDERRLIDQLAQFLFLDAPREGETVVPREARPRDEGATVSRPGADKAPRAIRPEPEKRGAPSAQRRAVVLAGAAAAVMVALAWGGAQWIAGKATVGPAGSAEGAVSVPAPAAEAASATAAEAVSAAEAEAASATEAEAVSAPAAEAVSAAEAEAASATAAVSVTAAESAAEPVCRYEPEPFDWLRRALPWLAFALVVSATFWLGRLWRRERRGRRQEANVHRIAGSTGPRVFRFDVPPNEPIQALEPSAVRDAAFQLSAPRREVSAPWVALRETVEATAKNLGLLSLRFARWKEQTSLLVLEDVSVSMVKWPCHGEQLVSALRRQGGEVAHFFFERSPGVLYASRELEEPAELDVVLCAHPHSVVIVVSDAAGIEPGYGTEPLWSRLLGGCIWLHPAPEPLWGRAARWLAARHRVVAMSPEGLMRLGAEDRRPSEAIAPPWEPPRVLSSDPVVLVGAWRGALSAPRSRGRGLGAVEGAQADEGAFWLLCAGALLEQRAGLTVRLLAALREDVVAAPWEETERLWFFPDLTIGSDGTLRFVPSVAESLVDTLRKERPELAQKVVDWATKVVEERSAGLEESSLAGLFARMTQLRLDAESPVRRAGAREKLAQLNEEGFGDALGGFATPQERHGWGLRLQRETRPRKRDWAAFLAFTLAAVALGAGILGTKGRAIEELWPREPRFAVATAGGAWQTLEVGGSEKPVVQLPPGSPKLYVCEERWLETRLSVWVDGRKEPRPLEPSSVTRAWALTDTLAGSVPREGGRTVDLGLGYSDEQRVALRVRLTAPEECTPHPMAKRTYRLDAGMVQLPGGSFCMGSNDGDRDEKPVHSVSVAALWMDQKEVTTAQYAACVSAKKCTKTDTGTHCNWGEPDRANHPINCVDWNQAVAYCAWEGKRLPTEEEWEYAARGTDGRTYFWGNTEPTASLACWNRTGEQGTCEVGSLPAGKSPFGLFDMAGNVWEWTNSPYCNSYLADCKALARVGRGGSWSSVDPSYVRAAFRNRFDPTNRVDYLGFRCARSG